MAWYPALYGGGGGDTTVHPVLIGHYTSGSTSAQSRTLTDSLANYKYVLFSMSPITSDSVWTQSASNASGMAFSDVDYFKNNNLQIRYTTSPSGTVTNRVATIAYTNDTTISTTFPTTNSALYVYGIEFT